MQLHACLRDILCKSIHVYVVDTTCVQNVRLHGCVCGSGGGGQRETARGGSFDTGTKGEVAVPLWTLNSSGVVQCKISRGGSLGTGIHAGRVFMATGNMSRTQGVISLVGGGAAVASSATRCPTSPSHVVGGSESSAS